MYTDSQFILRNTLGYARRTGMLEMKFGRWFAGKKKINSSIAFILRKAFCLAYVKVFNIYHLLCVGIALSSACKLTLTQKLVGSLVRGFYH